MAIDFSRLDIIVYVLAVEYAILVLVPIAQLLRICIRIPDVGWTTQKLFLVLTMLSSLVRCAFFVVVPYQHGNFFMVNFEKDPAFTILDTLPSALYFSTYTLLVLFWAEIIYHARNQSLSFPRRIRPLFLTLNIFVYLTLITFWLLLFFLVSRTHILDITINFFICGIYVLAAVGFLVYGGKLYLMLKQFPIESRGRSSKLKEVGWVTVICTSCFIVRVGLLAYGTLEGRIDYSDIFICSYYEVVEIVPSLLVLFVLRKLPPRKRVENKYGSESTPFLSADRYDPRNYQPQVDIN